MNKKEAIDVLLEDMAKLFANLGTESTIEEINEAYRIENQLIDAIAILDPEKARSIRPYKD